MTGTDLNALALVLSVALDATNDLGDVDPHDDTDPLSLVWQVLDAVHSDVLDVIDGGPREAAMEQLRNRL